MPEMTFEEIITKQEKATGCGVLVVSDDGKVLTGTRIERASRGQICGPGGHIEPGETPEEAAKREAMEEFGIECHDLRPLGTQAGGRKYGTSAVFLCTDYTGKPRTDEEEMTNPKWLTMRQIRRLDAFPPFLRSLDLLPDNTVQKFNPYHCHTGKFTTPNGAHSFTYKPGKSKAHDMAIEREKRRSAESGGSTVGSAAGDEKKAPKLPGNNTSQKEHHKETPGDMEHMFDDDSRSKCIDLCEKITGADRDDAERFYSAVQSFSGGGYSTIREYFQNGNTWSKREAENLEKFIEQSPKWDGGPLYRGVAVDKATADKILRSADEGKEINMMGPSSWSSREEIADSFARTSPGEVKIMFQTKGKQNGTSLKYMSVNSHEDEVVCSNNAIWKPTKIIKKDDGLYVIDCEPVHKTKTAKSFDEILKFNPYHDARGRFSTANGAASMTVRTSSAAGQKAIANIKEREKAKQQAAGGGGGTGSSAEEPETPATGNHKPHMKGKELVEFTAKELGVSEQEAKDMVREVSGYTDGYATDMRNWQQYGDGYILDGMSSKEARTMSEQCEKFIKLSPKWDGGELYRGISVSEDEAHKILDDISFSMQPFDMKGTSSWSSDKGIADDFGGLDDVTIIFKTPGTKKGTSIDHISDFSQSEVLISRDARWDVKRINGSIDDGYLEIEMEERP